jgi:putative ABC transport system substrate-binding protein
MNNAENDTETKAQLFAFRQGLQQLGWSEDRNVSIDIRFAADRPDQYQVLAKELVALQPDVIFGYTTPINTALQRETRTIPIVFAQVSDPIGSGLIASLARPEGNLTGFLLYEKGITGKWAAMLKEIAPQLRSAALLANPKTTPYDYFVRSAEATAQSLAIELVPSPVENAADIERVITTFAGTPDGGLLVLPSGTTSLHRDLVVELAARIACRRFIHSVSTSRPADSCPTVVISSTSHDRRHHTSTVFFEEPIPPNFRYRRRPST